MKICPLIKKECVKAECAWWDEHYNACAVLSSSILLEILTKKKSKG